MKHKQTALLAAGLMVLSVMTAPVQAEALTLIAQIESVTPQKATMVAGEQIPIEITWKDWNYSAHPTVHYSSSDTSVATVVNGFIYAENAGTATIYIETSLQEFAIDVTVYAPPGDPSYPDDSTLSLERLPDKLVYQVGEDFDMTGMSIYAVYALHGSYVAEQFMDENPADYPDIFELDTTAFDNTHAGTYPITVTYDRYTELGSGKRIPARTISFEVTVLDGAVLPGDMTLDSQIGVTDVVAFQKYLLKAGTLSAQQLSLADLNGDGTVDIYDMALLKRELIKTAK